MSASATQGGHKNSKNNTCRTMLLKLYLAVQLFSRNFKALKPNSITLASSELAPNMFGASSELASVMEFGFYHTHFQRIRNNTTGLSRSYKAFCYVYSIKPHVTTAVTSITKCKYKLECGSMPNVTAAQPNIGGALCESSVIPFLVPRRKVWLTPAAEVLCSSCCRAVTLPV